MATRNVHWINNFWKTLVHDPGLSGPTRGRIQRIIALGALDPLVKE